MLHTPSRARRVKTVNLDAVFAGAAYKKTVGYADGKLPAGVANDWVTRRSPSFVLRGFNVQSGLQDPGNNTLELLQSA